MTDQSNEQRQGEAIMRLHARITALEQKIEKLENENKLQLQENGKIREFVAGYQRENTARLEILEKALKTD